MKMYEIINIWVSGLIDDDWLFDTVEICFDIFHRVSLVGIGVGNFSL